MDDSQTPHVAVNDDEPALCAPSTATPYIPPAELPFDDEIAALLEFEPVPRKVKRPDGWTPARQREFIHRVALSGHPPSAARQMHKNISGIESLYLEDCADSFRAAWDGALKLAQERRGQRQRRKFAERAPGVNVRGASRNRYDDGPLPGQVLNEYDEYEDENSFLNRVEDAKDSIAEKLRRCRRLFLAEISGSPGKRAAYEILTEYPIDWEKAERFEPQADEPWRKTNMRNPDMLITAENGWMGEMTHGPNKLAELRKALDDHRAEEGLPPVDWEAEDRRG